ncbi:hypothetical protein SAMN05421823_102429 [Catalinimonas alkaloidigena]|uniref:Uncharacterized protein n=1 Tax=Catalinimonas alkaloidigena TaxID=1075417 RepID=A0A1G9AXP8_9BACT|nr:hypothetical protein [Catalinimonas alkaloidigena]SDK31644.1 hypothetical protein SAMN05421823_102429 [Catalinimonas alkaloidigena]
MIRNGYFLLLLVFLALSGNGRAQSFKSAGEYMAYMAESHEVITKDMWSYVKIASHSKRARAAEKRRMEVVNTIADAQKRISKMSAFEGDVSLRNSLADYLKMSYLVMNEDYAKIVDMEEIAEQSYDLMEAYLMAKDQANAKLNTAWEKMSADQKQFASAHNINLVDDTSKRSEKLKQASKVYAYYNSVFLIFFKSHKQEAFMLEALESQDLNAVEQNKNAVQNYASEGLTKLQSINAFQGDVALKQSCRDVLQFLQVEARDKMPVITDFYLKQETFEKVKAAFERKKASARTQADVDQYNKAVEEMNAAIGKFNATNEQLNKERSRVLEKWNKEVASFFDKHVP